MPSLVPRVSRKQMRQLVQTFLRGHQWMMLSQKQGLLVPWRPAASRITKVGRYWKDVPCFYTQYCDLGPISQLGTQGAQLT